MLKEFEWKCVRKRLTLKKGKWTLLITWGNVKRCQDLSQNKANWLQALGKDVQFHFLRVKGTFLSFTQIGAITGTRQNYPACYCMCLVSQNMEDTFRDLLTTFYRQTILMLWMPWTLNPPSIEEFKFQKLLHSTLIIVLGII